MFTIVDDVIYITRGDDAVMPASIITESGDEYEMQSGDILTFSVKKSTKPGNALLTQIMSDSPCIVFKPEHTKHMDVGSYSADLQLTTADGLIFTVYPKQEGRYLDAGNWANFRITPEVTE